MFDVETSTLIRSAPPLRGVNPEVLPQELTGIYAELVALRLREDDIEAIGERAQLLERLARIATIYEACADTLQDHEPRRAAAFVSATAHQILGRVMSGAYDAASILLSASSIHPLLAAPLLFLVAEQNADAREAARALSAARDDNLIKSALVETVYDLASENYQSILDRAARLSQARAPANEFGDGVIEQALYGLCWSGIIRMVSGLLGVESPKTQFLEFESPLADFEAVIELSVERAELDGALALTSFSVFGGPRHLASLLKHLCVGLQGSGVANIPLPAGAAADFWGAWLRHRAKSKPVLWRNHRRAVETGFLDRGKSAVLVLPTGGGKTTLSELKIASTLAGGSKVVFLVPTLALVDQLRDELAETFPESIGDVEVAADGDLTGTLSSMQLKSIEVMTPERCLALVSHNPESLEEVGLVVFDECHLMSSHGGGTRSLDAMLCLLQAIRRAPGADHLLLSAMVTNAEDLARWIESITERPCISFQDSWKPSRQARGVVLYSNEEVREISRDARAPRKRGARLRRKKDAMPYGLFGLHQNWNSQVATDIRLIRLANRPVELSVTKRGSVAPNANKVAARLAVDAALAGLKTIVFVQQTTHALSTARNVSEQLDGNYPLSASELALWEDVQIELGGADHSLVCPGAAALAHNGDMIPMERRLAESLYRKANGASVIVATPTLAQGMNLPAQLAILAGDKRHGDGGRSSLAAHEILNAAGRAGRAGHLANGIVLLVPEPTATFDGHEQPAQAAFTKLRNLLPADDKCVAIVDPLTNILDRIQGGEVEGLDVRYFVSRIQAAQDTEQAAANALSLVRGSFAKFLADKQNASHAFEEKVGALEQLIANGPDEGADVYAIAASHGCPVEPLLAIRARMEADSEVLPTSIIGWLEWLIDFFQREPDSYVALLDSDVDIALSVMRGSKQGGPPTAAEFENLKGALRLWLQGRPYKDIEVQLGAEPEAVDCCERTRDMVLKLANRRLYLVLSAVSEVARGLYAERGVEPPQPAVLETLAVAVRKGFDTPQKVAFEQATSKKRTRVRMHVAFLDEVRNPPTLEGQSFQALLEQIEIRMMFAGNELFDN